jgi:site-specific recombinase XerC
MQEYLDVLCERLVLSDKMARRTLADYRSKTKNWIIPLLGRHRLDRLTPEHLDTAYAIMLRRGLSASTVLKIHRILSRALRIAVRRGRVGRNVATLVDAPAAAAHEVEALTREEARRILAVAAAKRNGARWSVAVALGIRQGEALGLRWSYVDLETGVIRAWYQIQRTEWKHGCDEPQACGALWHRPACKPRCQKHRHLRTCAPDCSRKGHVCYKRPCPPSCTGHADKCPSRIGGGLV